MGPAELYEGELAAIDDGKWKDAFEVYVSDTGDELLLARDGSLGWLRHEDRQIVDYAADFAVVIDNLLRDGSLGYTWP